jgi:oligopeptide/dipeptide ABC transporter ATP-binding protein
MADEVAVVYLGQIVEYGSVRQVFKEHKHPYTEGLLSSIPVLGVSKGNILKPIEGIVPDPRNMPSGCRFSDRCPDRFGSCTRPPPLFEVGNGHQARCWLHSPEAAHVR